MAGQLRVAVVVKATFLLVPDHSMAAVDPDPILAADLYGDAAHGAMREARLVAANDLAPYRPRADVLVYGHARAFLGKPTAALRVRLLVARDQDLLLDKRLTLPGPGRVDSLGPLSSRSEARRRLLNVDPALLSAPVPDLPVNFAWGHFNVAPDDQRIEFLRGDEWVGFDGFHSQIERVQSCLPGVQGTARLYGPSPGLRAGRAIPLVADTLIIDADRLRCWVVWRGSFGISSEDELARHHIVAGVEAPGSPLRFPASYSDPPAAEESTESVDDLIVTPRILPALARGSAAAYDATATTEITVDTLAQVRAAPATPFDAVPRQPTPEAPARPPPLATPFEGALLTPPAVNRDAGAMTAITPPPSLRPEAAADPLPDSRLPVDLTSTLALPLISDVESEEQPRPAPVIPFIVSTTHREREAPAGSLPLAMPFEGAPLTAPSVNSEAGVMTMIAPRAADGESPLASPGTLGALFLAAMARAAERGKTAPSR